jgi:hypothetical protein
MPLLCQHSQIRIYVLKRESTELDITTIRNVHSVECTKPFDLTDANVDILGFQIEYSYACH